MKRISFYILILCLAHTVNGQHTNTYSGFTIVGKEVVWSQVYHVDGPADSLSGVVWRMLKDKGWIRNLHREDADLVGDIERMRVDYKRYGGRYLNTSQLIRTGRWTGKVRISFRDDKYRVVVSHLAYDARQPAMHAAKMSTEAHPIHGTWDEWVLNKYRTHFRSSRRPNMDIMNAYLKDGFTLSPNTLIDEDW